MFTNIRAGLTFFLPITATLNLFKVMCVSCGYVQGLRSDYLLPKLYLVDLVMVAILVVWLGKKILAQEKILRLPITGPTLLFVLGSGALGVTQLLAEHPLVAIWNWLQLVLIGLTGWWLWHHRAVYYSTLVAGMAAALILQTGLSWYQFMYQRPLLPYHFLGESNIQRAATINQVAWGGAERVPPYGSTAHPNVLGGFMALYSVVIVKWLVEQTKLSWLKKVAVVVTLTASWSVLLLTQSSSAAATLVMGGVAWAIRPYLLKLKPAYVIVGLLVASWLIGFITSWYTGDQPSLARRAYLLKAAGSMEVWHRVSGVGLSNFTAVAEQYSPSTEIVRFNQPVHHVLALWLSETGGIGFLLVLLALIWLERAEPSSRLSQSVVVTAWIVLLPIANWDHYLLSLETGRTLALLFLWGWSTMFTEKARILS